MRTYTKIIKNLDDWLGDASLYKLSEFIAYNEPFEKDDPPAEKTEFIVVSSVTAIFSGPETFIFPADKEGNCLNWSQLEGSYQGGLDHIKALNNLGFYE